MTGQALDSQYGEAVQWSPQPPRFRLVRVLVSWLVATLALLVAAAIVAGVSVHGFGGALLAAALIAILNAVLPPLVAALRLPFTLALGFVLVLFVDALMLLVVSEVAPDAITVDTFGDALLASLVMAAASVVLEVIFGADDDDTYTLRVIRRIARRQGKPTSTDAPGIVYLEIDGLALPVLQRAMRDGHAPNLARWLQEGTHRLVEWETDLSSQTGASQAGILLGSNEDIPAFRWVEKETGRLMTCSAPADCAEIEARHASGRGLLIDGGASRGNLLSGEADEVILTVSRMEAEKQANPGYRPFLANGFNVTRALVLFGWEVILELLAATRQRRRDIRPRGHRGGYYPFLRAALCVVVRDLIVFGVLTDMMSGRPAVYATFSSYDEVAHHSGLERTDTMEALYELDEHFGRIARACRYAPRPYKLVVLSDHGQTQGATFKQRNGYGLDELVERSLETGTVSRLTGGDENDAAVGHALNEATGRAASDGKSSKDDVSDREVIVLGSGNLGLDLPDGRAAALDARGDRRAPSPVARSAAGAPPHRLSARALSRARAGRPRRARHQLPGHRSRRRRGSARRLLEHRIRAPGTHRRLRARRGHHGQQLLRPPARRGLRLRGAHLIPRGHGRPPDPSLPVLSQRAAGAPRADHRRRFGASDPQRLAPRSPVRAEARSRAAACQHR